MKTILLLAAIIGVALCALTAEQKAAIKQSFQECATKENVDPELRAKLRQGEFTEDQNLKCYVKCVMIKSGFYTEEGEFKSDVVVQKVATDANREAVQKTVESCSSVTSDDTCDKAFKLLKCYYEANNVIHVDDL